MAQGPKTWDGADYRPFSPPRRAVLYAGGKVHDVLVLRYRRGRWQIKLPPDAEAVSTDIPGQRNMLRPGKTVSVPEGMIEFVDGPPGDLPGGEAGP